MFNNKTGLTIFSGCQCDKFDGKRLTGVGGGGGKFYKKIGGEILFFSFCNQRTMPKRNYSTGIRDGSCIFNIPIITEHE